MTPDAAAIGTPLHTDDAIQRLPVNTVVASSDGEVFQKYGDAWHVPGMRHTFSRVAPLPASILRMGGAK